MKAIVLVSGKMRSGKNQFSSFFCDIAKENSFRVQEFAFAEALKKHCYYAFSKINELNGYSYSQWDSKKTDLTRAILTGVGTELVQQIMGFKTYWVDKLVESLNRYNIMDRTDNTVAIVTDLRYEHEIEGVQKFAYDNDIPLYIVRIESNRKQKEHNKALETHASEVSLDKYDAFSYIVENNGTLDEFKDSTKLVYQDIMEDIKNYV